MSMRHGRPIGLTHLTTFYHAAQFLNFSQAAKALGSDQPAVSRRISELERQLGHPLFARLGGPRGVSLTPAGEKLLELAAGTVEELMRLPERFSEEMSQTGPQELRVIGGQQLLLSLLAPALFAFAERRPAVNVAVTSALKPEVIEAVRSGTADIGLTSATRIPRDLAYDEVLSDRIDEAFRSLELTPRIGMDLQRWEVIREFVALGLGIAIVPGFVARGLSGTATLEVNFQFPRRSYGILTAKSQHLTRAARELIAGIRNAAEPKPAD
jgi:DNA-binding transcriptional LysR family regulator